MPAIGEGRRSSSFEPAGRRFNKAARGSAEGSAGAARAASDAAWAGSAATACSASVCAARTSNPAAQASTAKTARILDMNDSGGIDSLDPAPRRRFTQSYRDIGRLTEDSSGAFCNMCVERYENSPGRPGESHKRPAQHHSPEALPPRMMLRMQFLQTFARHVSVNLSRRQIAMPQQHLHHAQIRPVVQQMSREGMAQGVRRELFLHAGLLRIALDDVPEGLARHAVAAARRKQV